MEDNAVISGNTAKKGGGIFLQDKLILQGNAKIIENSATKAGGGVLGATEGATVTKGGDAVIADINFTFN
jgi:predicted outer membrane repeat protein